jgi:hypothetical protein
LPLLGRIDGELVILRVGQHAGAIFSGADGPVGKARSCPSFVALRVTPPGNAQSVRLSAWIPYLDADLPDCASIRISPVLPDRR